MKQKLIGKVSNGYELYAILVDFDNLLLVNSAGTSYHLHAGSEYDGPRILNVMKKGSLEQIANIMRGVSVQDITDSWIKNAASDVEYVSHDRFDKIYELTVRSHNCHDRFKELMIEEGLEDGFNYLDVMDSRPTSSFRYIYNNYWSVICEYVEETLNEARRSKGKDN